MRTVSVQDFHDHVTKWLRGKETIVVTRYGKEPLGVFYPASVKDAPKEIRWAIFEALTNQVGEQLKKKGSFRRVIKQRCEATMNAGAKGVKIKLSGRLGGAEMARQETQIQGSIPLHTLQANVQYGFSRAVTKTGTIGVKVWLYLGRYGEEVEGKDVGDRGGRGSRGGGKRFKRG